MKKIRCIIVLLFVLFSISTIAQNHSSNGAFIITKESGVYTIKQEITINYEGQTGIFSVPVDGSFPTLKSTIDYVKTKTTDSKCYDLEFRNITSSNENLTEGYTFHSLTLTNSSISFTNGTLNIHNSVLVKSNSELTLTNNLILNGGTLTIQTNALGAFSNANLSNSTITTQNSSSIQITGGSTNLTNSIMNIATGSTINLTNATISDAQLNSISNAIIIGKNHTKSLTLSLQGGKWNFIGFPHCNNISLLANIDRDIWAIGWDYSTNNWNTETYLQYNNDVQSVVERGTGIFVVSNSNYTGQHSITMDNLPINNLTFNGHAPSNQGRWFCLANPFNCTLSTKKIFSANPGQIQSICTFNGTTFTTTTYYHDRTIAPFQGFMLNMISNNETINLDLEELYYSGSAKSEVEEVVNYIDIDVITDDYAVPVTFLHKETALAEYDIFDADKMFGSGAVAEPYFVLGERNLCIEAANTLPYTAPMNIKSGEARNVQIVVSHIPEQYEVTLVDGEEEIALEAGVAYETMIASGENEDRFKVIINKKNSVSISDVENVSEISLRQYNRNIIIEGGKNIHTEIFNMLGQKVYETADRNFMLNKVDAGAYVVKVKDGNSVSTTKIVVK